jgi:hypothetical protein
MLTYPKASRCRKKRKILIQDLEKHAQEVSLLNHSLTLQIEELNGQMNRLHQQLQFYHSECQCGLSGKTKQETT